MSDKLRGDNSGQYRAAAAATTSATFSCSLPGTRSTTLSQVGSSQSANPCTTLYGVQKHDSSGVNSVSNKGQTSSVPRHSNGQSELEMAFQKRLRQPKKKFPKEAPDSSTSADACKSPPPQVNNVPPVSSTVSSASVSSQSQPQPQPQLQSQPQKHSHFSPSSPPPPPRSSSLHKTTDIIKTNGQTPNVSIPGYRKVTTRGLHTPRSFNQDFSDFTDSEDCRTPDVSIFNMSEGYRTPLESEDEADTASKHSYAASSTRYPFKSEIVKQFEKPVPVFLKCQSWCNQLPDETEPRQPINDPTLSKELQNIESFESAMLDWFQTLNRTNDDDDLRSETSVSSMGSFKSEYRLRSLINNRFQNSEQIENVLTDLLKISDQYGQATDTESVASESQKSVQTLKLQKTSQPRRGRATVIRRSSIPGDVSGSESESEPPKQRGDYKNFLSELQGVLRHRRPIPDAPDSEESGLGSSEYSNPPISPLSPTSIPPTPPKPQFPKVHAPKAARTAQVTNKPLVNAGDFKFFLGELSTAWSRRLKRIRKAQMVSQRGMQSSLYANFQGFRIPETLTDDKSTKYANFQGKLEPAKLIEPECRADSNKESEPRLESVSKPMFGKIRGQATEKQVLPSEIAKKETMSKPQKQTEAEPPPPKEMTGQELLESVQKPGLKKTTFKMNKYIRNVASGGALPEISEEMSVSALNKGRVPVPTSMHCQVPSAYQVKSSPVTKYTNIKSPPPPDYIHSVSSAPIQSPVPSQVKSSASVTSPGTLVSSCSSPIMRSFPPSQQIESPIPSPQVNTPQSKVRIIASPPKHEVWTPPSKAKWSSKTDIKPKPSPSLQETTIKSPPPPPSSSRAITSPAPPPPPSLLSRTITSPPPPPSSLLSRAITSPAPPPPSLLSRTITSPPPPPSLLSHTITSPPPPPPSLLSRAITSPPPPSRSSHAITSPPPPSSRSSRAITSPPPPQLSRIITSPPPPPSRSSRAIKSPPPLPETVRSTFSPPSSVQVRPPPRIPIPPPPPISEDLLNNAISPHTDIKAEPSIHPLSTLPHSRQGSAFTIIPQTTRSTHSSFEPVQVNVSPQIPISPASPVSETLANNIIIPSTQFEAEPSKHFVPTLLSHDRQRSAFTVPPSRGNSSDLTEKIDKTKAENTFAASDPTIEKTSLDGVADRSDQFKSTVTEVVKKTEENLTDNFPVNKAISSPCFTSNETLALNSKVSFISRTVRASPVSSRSITPTMTPALIEEKRLILERLTKIGERNVIAKEELPELPMDIMKASTIKIKPLVTENIQKLVRDVREGSKEGSPVVDELRQWKKSEVVMEIQSSMESPNGKNQSDLSVDMNIPLVPNEPDVSKSQALPKKSMISLDRIDEGMETAIPQPCSDVTDIMPESTYDVDLEKSVAFLGGHSAADENQPESNVSHIVLESQIEIPAPETDSLVTNLRPKVSYDVDLKTNVGFLDYQSDTADEIKPDENVSLSVIESQIEIPAPEAETFVTNLMPKISYDVDLENKVGFLDNTSAVADEIKPDENVSHTVIKSEIEIPVPETNSFVTNLMPKVSYDVDLKTNVGFLDYQSDTADENKPDNNLSLSVIESQIEIPVPEPDSLVTNLMPNISYDVDLENKVGFLDYQSTATDDNKPDHNVSHSVIESQIEIPVPETDSPVTNLKTEIVYDVDLENKVEFLNNQSVSYDETTSHTELDSLMETVLLNLETIDSLLPGGEMRAEKKLSTTSDGQSQKMSADSVTFPVSLPEDATLLEVKENANPMMENSTEFFVVTSQENESLEETENDLLEKYFRNSLEERDSEQTMEFLVKEDFIENKESLSEKNSRDFKELNDIMEALVKNDFGEMEPCELQATFVDDSQDKITPIADKKNLEETFEISIGEDTPFNEDDVSYSIVCDDSGDRIPSEEELECLWVNPVTSHLAATSEITIVKEGDMMPEEVVHMDITPDEGAVAASESVPETLSTETSEFLAVTDIVEDKPALETVADIMVTATNPELLQECSTVPDAETEKTILNPEEISTAELQIPEAVSLEEVSSYNVYSDNISDEITVPAKITELAQMSHFIPVFSPLEPEMPVFENPPDVFNIPVQEVVPTVMDAGEFVEISGQEEILFAPSEQEELMDVPSEQEEHPLMDEPEISLDQLKQSIKEEMLKSEDITKVFNLENLKSLGPNGSPDDHEFEDAVSYSSDDSLTFEDTLTSPIMSRRVYKEVVRAEIGSRVETLQSWAKPEPLKSWPNQENLQLCSGEELVEDSDLHEFHEAEEIISSTDSDVLPDSDQQQLVYTLPTIYEATEESVEEERRILREINHVDQLIGECVETLEMSPVELAQVQEQDQILCDAEIPDFISQIELERDVQLDSVLANLKSGAAFSAVCASNDSTALFGELKRSQGLTALDQICTDQSDQSPESQIPEGSPPEKISDHTSPEIFSDDELLNSIPYNVTIERPELFEDEILPAMSTKAIFDKMGVGKIFEDDKFEETEDEVSPAQTRSEKASEDEISPALLRSEKTSEDEEASDEDWLKGTNQTDLQLPRLVQTQQPLADKFENLLEYLESDAAKELREFEQIESACEILSKDHRKDSVVSNFSIGTIEKSDELELLIKSLDSELEEDMTQKVLANPKEDLVPGVVMFPQDVEQQDMDIYKIDSEDHRDQIKENDTCEDDFFDAYSESEYLEYMLSRDPEDSGYIDAVPLYNTTEIEFEQTILLEQSTVQDDTASPNISSLPVDEGVDEDDQNDIDSNYLSYLREREMETYELMTAKNTVISDMVTDVENTASSAVNGKSTPHLELVITVPESEEEKGTISEDIFLAPDSSIKADEKTLIISDEIEEEFFTIKGTENTVEKAFEYLLSSNTLPIKEDNDTSPDPKTDHSLSPVEISSSASEDTLSPGNYSVSHEDVAEKLPEIEVHKLQKPTKKRKNKKGKISKDGATSLTEISSENISTEQESIVSLCTSETTVIDTDNIFKDSSSPHISRSKNDAALLSVCESESAGKPTTKTRLASTSSSSTERSASVEHAVVPPGSLPLSEDTKDPSAATSTSGKKKRKKKKKKGKEKEEPMSPTDIGDGEKLNSDQVEFNVEAKHESNISTEIVAEVSGKEARDDVQNDSKDSERIDSIEEFSTKDQVSDLPELSMAISVPEVSSEEIGSHRLASESSTLIIANEMSIEKETVPPTDLISESLIIESAIQEMQTNSSESAEVVSSSVIAPSLQEMQAISSESAEKLSSLIIASALQEMSAISSKSSEEISSSIMAMTPPPEEIPTTSSESTEQAPSLEEMATISPETTEEVSFSIVTPSLEEMPATTLESVEDVPFSIVTPSLEEMPATTLESTEDVSFSIVTPSLEVMPATTLESAEDVSFSIVTPSLEEMATISPETTEEVSFSIVTPSLKEMPATTSESAEDVSFSLMAPASQEMPVISLELVEEVSSSIIASALQEMSAISSESVKEISSEKQDAVTGEISEVTLSSALESLNHVGLFQDQDINSSVSLNQSESFSKQITNETNDSTQSILAVVVPETSIDVSISATVTEGSVPLAPRPELEQTLPIVSSASEHPIPVIPNLETPAEKLDSVTSLEQPASVAIPPSSTTIPVSPTPSSSSLPKQSSSVVPPPTSSSLSKQPNPVASVPSPPPKQCAPAATLTASSLKQSPRFSPLLSSTPHSSSLSSATRSSSLSSLTNRECQIHRYGAKCPLKVIEHRTDFSESYQKKAAFLANLPRPVEYPRLYRCPSSDARFGQPPPVPCSLRDMEPPQPPSRKLSKDNGLSDSVKSQSEIGAPLCRAEDTKLSSPTLERSKNTTRNGYEKSSTLSKSPQTTTQTNSPSKRFRDLKHFSRISNMTYNEVIEMEEEEHRRRYDYGTGRRIRDMRYFGRICHGDSEESMISKKSESSDSGILTGYRDLKQSRMMNTSSTSLQTPGMSATGGCRPKGLADSAVSIDNPRQFEPVMSYVAYGQSGDATATEIQQYSSSVSNRSNTLQPSDRHRQDLGGYGQIQKSRDMVRSTQSLDYHAGRSKFIRPEIGLSEQDVTNQGFQDSGLCASNCSVNGHESDDSRSMRSSVSFVIPEHRTMENIVMDDDSESIYEDVAMYPSSDTMSLRSDVGSVKSLSKLKKFGSKLKKFSKIKFKKFWK